MVLETVDILLISTYELGRQPFGLASPAAWLREAGYDVACQDLSQEKLDNDKVRAAQLICIYLPMHTATRIALNVMDRVRELNPQAHLCCYGLYAPANAEMLRSRGVQSVIGGEFEAGLVEIARAVAAKEISARVADVDLSKLSFRVPDRAGLPPLKKYSRLRLPNGEERIVGYTEASRGCRHLCRHCPIVPVYNGAFRIVQREVVLEDIRRQVAAGAQHITFGDPDFFNGPGHALAIVEALHREFPSLSYDVTIKIEHLLQFADHLPRLHDTGCVFVTTAVESVDDRVLALLDKGHTRADFFRAVELMRRIGLPLAPTFIPFTPWTTLAGYFELLRVIRELGLIENVAPVQLAIRLLVPAGSKLLELPELRGRLDAFDAELLSYRWRTPDARVDTLQRAVEQEVARGEKAGLPRAEIFGRVEALASESASDSPERLTSGEGMRKTSAGHDAECAAVLSNTPVLASRATIPYLTEPWYC